MSSTIMGSLIMLLMMLASAGIFWFVMRNHIEDRFGESKKMVLIVAGIALLIFAFVPYMAVQSYKTSKETYTEIWGGQIVKKDSEHVHCRHDYQCHCYSYTDSKGNSHQHCDTCYEHSYDVDWTSYDNIGDDWDMGKVDRQGLIEPPAWTQVVIGEPVAVPHTYLDYIKASKFSILNKRAREFDAGWPPITYPGNIYDRWRTDRVIASGVNIPDLKEWNDDLMVLNGQEGPAHQASVIVVFTNIADRDYADAVYERWKGAAKNDIVVFIGAPNYPTVSWTAVRAFTQSDIFQRTLESEIPKEITRPVLFAFLKNEIEHDFQREHMKKYQYLEDDIDVPLKLYVWVYVAFVVVMFLIFFVASRMANDNRY